MKVSSWARMVAPPNTTMMPRLSHCMGSTLPLECLSQAICATVATIATAVAT